MYGAVPRARDQESEDKRVQGVRMARVRDGAPIGLSPAQGNADVVTGSSRAGYQTSRCEEAQDAGTPIAGSAPEMMSSASVVHDHHREPSPAQCLAPAMRSGGE